VSGAGGAGPDEVVATLDFDRIVPIACRTPNGWPDDRLPPADCANEANLIHIVANPADLFRGREMGPPQAAPVARAAERYLEFGGQAVALTNEAARHGAAYGYPPGTAPAFRAGPGYQGPPAPEMVATPGGNTGGNTASNVGTAPPSVAIPAPTPAAPN
jgi:hypothetical protein